MIHNMCILRASLFVLSEQAVAFEIQTLPEQHIIAVEVNTNKPSDFAKAFEILVANYIQINKSYSVVFPQLSISINQKIMQRLLIRMYCRIIVS